MAVHIGQQTPSKGGLERGCNYCTALPICAIYRAIAPMLEEIYPEDKAKNKPLKKGEYRKIRPFEAEDLAMICQYFSVTIMKT